MAFSVHLSGPGLKEKMKASNLLPECSVLERHQMVHICVMRPILTAAKEALLERGDIIVHHWTLWGDNCVHSPMK